MFTGFDFIKNELTASFLNLPTCDSLLQPSTHFTPDLFLAMSKAKGLVEELTLKEYASIHNQAVELETVPNDIRVWDRYLYSKCDTPDEAWSLVQVYALLKKKGVDSETALEWCDHRNFVQNSSATLSGLPDAVTPLLWLNRRKFERSLSVFYRPTERLREHRIKRYDNSAPVNTAIQEKWSNQAMECARRRKTDLDRLDLQKAHFALGMIVFQQRPRAEYLWSDRSLDIWYDMGFAVVFHPDGPGYLQNMYECLFRQDLGIPSQSFEKFYGCWTIGTFAQDCEQLAETDRTYRKFKLWTTMREFQNLKRFLKARPNKREESVWRLRHILAVPERKEEFLGPGKECLHAWKDYGLCPGDSEYQRARENVYTIDAFTEKRKKLYRDVLNARKDPKALHRAMTDGSIRVYVRETLQPPAEDVYLLP